MMFLFEIFSNIGIVSWVPKTTLSFDNLEGLTEITESHSAHGFGLLQGKDTY